MIAPGHFLLFFAGAPSSASGSAPGVILGALTLDDTTADVGAAWSATISSKTSGSTITATSSDGTVLSVVGTTVSGTFTTAGTPNVTLTETHADGSNSPRNSVIAVTVSAVSGVPDGRLMWSTDQMLWGTDHVLWS